ncbi:MAG: dephospho-CoA kinase [Acidimicrobiales bacterium]|jgi:dephospho-CoA kinase|nr:dephospho-CoA kinase [Acidimicrobiales bacterium]
MLVGVTGEKRMVVVGLTGGIGSGKSTVSGLLAERGAIVIDADRIAADVRAPGGAAYQPLIDRFGPTIVAADGTIDRKALAEIAFADEKALADLNAITHPAIGAEIAARMAAEAGTDHLVLLDVPLLVENGRVTTDEVIVVDCPVDEAVRRLVEYRGFDEADARRRVAAQVTRDERLAKADFVIDNSGAPEALGDQVTRCWTWLESVRAEHRARSTAE